MKLDVVHLQHRIDECNRIIERCKEKISSNQPSVELTEMLEHLEERRTELERQLNQAGNVYPHDSQFPDSKLI
jgi:hypothetical protein